MNCTVHSVHHRGRQRTRLLVVLALTVVVFAVEATASIFANSLALLAEAFHVLIDVVALGAAYLDVLADVAASVAVITSALANIVFGRQLADTFAAFLIVALIVPRSFSLLREAIDVLLEATPRNVNVDTLREHVLGCSGVLDIHDLHVWTITSGVNVISAHVVMQRGADPSAVLDDLATCLRC